MFIINENLFVGEIAIPQLAVSRVLGSLPTYGSAKAIQTSGENNLDVFVDTKTTEYLRLMFGDFAKQLAQTWFLYDSDDIVVQDVLTSFDNDVERKGWQRFPISFDLTFEDLVVINRDKTVPFTEEVRFDTTKVYKCMIGEVNVVIRIDHLYSMNLWVDEGLLEDVVLIKSVHKSLIPTPFERKVYNVLLPYNGHQQTSPIANYVWYHLNADARNYSTTMGDADLNFANAISGKAGMEMKAISVRNKLINAWNQMANMNLNVVSFIRKHQSQFGCSIPFNESRHLLRTINHFNL